MLTSHEGREGVQQVVVQGVCLTGSLLGTPGKAEQAKGAFQRAMCWPHSAS